MALDFLAGCLGGCAGVLVGHPFDTVKVHLQTQDAKNPLYKGTYHCLKTIVAKESFRGLYRGMSSPMGGVAFVNAIVFGIYGNIERHINDPNSIKSHFLAGTVAGLTQSFICAPMELAKTRLQLQANYKGAVMHKNPLHCLHHIFKTDGFKGVFRGLGITALRDVPGFSSYFVSYELMMKYSSNQNALHTLMAGGLAGTISWLVTFPIDVIKSRLQADGIIGKPIYNGVLDCMRKGYQAEGLSFYSRGLVSTLIRAFPMNAACFFVVSQVMKLTDKMNLNVKIHSPESISFIGTNSTPITNFGHLRHHNHDLYDSLRRKSHLVKSLLFFGAFSEAVCHSEIIELANDLYDDQYSYYNFNRTHHECIPLNLSDNDSILFLSH